VNSANSIDPQFRWAAGYALAGAVPAFFGFIHGTQMEVAASPLVAVGYALMAGICFLVGWQQETAEGTQSVAVVDEEAPAE
jgi:AGZA family xanthine/uracil permease-like MFS transporter